MIKNVISDFDISLKVDGVYCVKAQYYDKNVENIFLVVLMKVLMFLIK